MAVPVARAVSVGPGAAVCEEADLQGSISFGSQAIAHPKSAVLALAAPVVIGDRSILEDHARLENADASQLETNSAVAMTVGSDNIFESGCVVRSTSVGDGNWFEPRAETKAGSVIGSHCVIGSGVVIERDEVVPDNSIIVCVQDPTGTNVMRRIVRAQKDYLKQARVALTQKYVDTFLDAKSPFALAKNHRMIPSAVARP
jgi:dynactin 6